VSNAGVRKNGHIVPIEEVRAERLAQLFYHYHHSLLADVNALSTPRTESWDQVPEQERRRLVSAARLTLLELSTEDSKQKTRSYSATPGEAEWGC
jgi:hypothetical protein